MLVLKGIELLFWGKMIDLRRFALKCLRRRRSHGAGSRLPKAPDESGGLTFSSGSVALADARSGGGGT